MIWIPLLLGCGGELQRPDPVLPDVALQVLPVRATYRPGQQVTLTATVDPSGPVTFAASPATAATVGRDGVTRLVEPGEITLSACSAEPVACDAITVLVDDGAPLLDVQRPQPGEELDGETIEVAGSVADLRDVRVFVGGQPVDVDATGQFTASIAPAFGVVPIEVVATDGLDEASAVTFDVLWADGYGPAVDDGQPAVAFDDGLTLQLGTAFFDDGSPLDPDVVPLVTRDLADLLQLVVASTDLAAVLPDPVVDDGGTFTLRIPEVRIGTVDVAVTIADGALELAVRLGDVEVDTEGALDLAGTPIDLSGGLTASVSAFARLVVLTPPGEPVTATLADLQVALDTAHGRFASPEADALFEVAASGLRTTLETELRGAIEGTLASTLPSLLTGTLNALDTALRERTIPLSIPGATPIALQLDGRLSTVALSPGRSLRATLQTAFGVATAPRFEGSRGFARGPEVDTDPLFRTRPAQLGVRLDLLNGAAHALWNAGLLDLDATALLPSDLSGLIQRAELDGRLPPVLRRPRGPSDHDLILDVGQLELDMTSLDARSRFGLSLSAGVSLDLVDDRVVLQVADSPDLRVWIIEREDPEALIDDALLDALLTSVVWPGLQTAITDALALDLPALDASLFGGLAPGLEGFAFRYGLAGPVDVRGGALVLDVELLGELP